MARRRRKMGEQLKRWGLLNDDQLQKALTVAKGQRKRIGETLVDLGFVGDGDVAKALAAQFEMDYVDLDQPNVIDPKNMRHLPQDLIEKYHVLPLEQKNGRLKVLIHDPMDLELIDNLRFRLNCEIDTAIGSHQKIKDFIDKMLSQTSASIDKELAEMSIDMSIDRGASLDLKTGEGDVSIDMDASSAAGSDEAPVVRLVNQIITEAVLSRASDIHIEPFTDRIRLRYRIDGVCVERDKIPKRVQSSVTARIKIMSGMKVEEKRNTQDGRIKMQVAGDMIDFRVSC